MKKIILLLIVAMMIIPVFTGCQKEDGPIIWVWYPNESGEETKEARDAIAKVVEDATGRKVEHKLTTDYIIAIESIANGNAHLGFFGAQGYIQANEKNSKVQPLVVNSGSSGTLEDAIYYSWMIVNLGDETGYQKDGKYSIENIAGKRYSFVSNSSTSGFRVPSSDIISYFSKQEKWASLTADDLIEGGNDKFFSEVLFGGSHQGSAVNLLSGKADVAAVCDTCVANYVDLFEGTINTAGAVYIVKDDAVEPFDTVRGKKFVSISSTPVLNAPFVVNTTKLSAEEIEKILEALTSDSTTDNGSIFIKKDSDKKGFFKEGQKFLEVEDSWFNPIRELN